MKILQRLLLLVTGVVVAGLADHVSQELVPDWMGDT